MRKITIKVDNVAEAKIMLMLADIGLELDSFEWLCEHLLHGAVAQIGKLKRRQGEYTFEITVVENPMRKPA